MAFSSGALWWRKTVAPVEHTGACDVRSGQEGSFGAGVEEDPLRHWPAASLDTLPELKDSRAPLGMASSQPLVGKGRQIEHSVYSVA
jgi:hypothetical protein